MQKLILSLLLITSSIVTPELYAKEAKPVKDPTEKFAASPVPFSLPLTDDKSLGDILASMADEGAISSYPQELASVLKRLKSGKKTVSTLELRTLMPYILKRIAPQLLEGNDLEGVDLNELITRAQRIKDGCNQSINKDVTKPVTKNNIDLGPVIRLLCQIQKEIEECCELLCKKIENIDIDIDIIIDTITECCADLSEQIEECCDDLKKDIRECCDDLSDQIAEIDMLSDEIIETLTECCDDLSEQIQEVKNIVEECCDDLSDQISEISFSEQTIIETLTECCDDLSEQIQEVKNIVEECCDDLSDKIAEIDMLSDEIIETLTECCDDLSEQIQEVKNIVEECCDDLAEDIGDLSVQVDECCTELLETLTECCDDLSEQIQEVKNIVEECCDDLSDQISEISFSEQTIIETLTECCDDLSEQIQEVKNIIEECCDDLSEDIGDLSVQVDECCTELLETLTECCDDLSEQIQDVRNIVEECCDDLSDQMVEINFASDEIIEAITECCDDLSEQIQEVRNIVEECCDDLENKVDESFEDLSDQLGECCTELLETLTECCDDLSEQIQEVKNIVEECCDGLSEDIGDLSVQVDECCTELLETLTECCDDLSEQIQDVRNIVEECCNDLSDQIAEIDMLSDDIIETLTECCDDLSEQIQEVKNIVEECCDDLSEDIGDLSVQVDECCTDLLETLTECCDDLSEQIQDVKNIVEECCDDLAEDIGDLAVQVDECCTDLLETLTECCDDLSEQIQDVKNIIEECCDDLSEDIDDLSGQLDECCTDLLETLTQCCDDLFDEIQDVKAILEECCDDLSDGMGDFSGQLDECCTELLETLTQCCEDLSDQIEIVNRNLEECCEDLENKIDEGFEDLSDQLDECCTELLETLTECCDDLSNQINEVNRNLDECCDDLSEQLDDLSSQLDECCEDILDTLTRIGDCCGIIIRPEQIPFVIEVPGNYVLQESVFHSGGVPAITIDSDNVCLDLCCASIIGQNADVGIASTGHKNITIRNGSIDSMDTAAIDLITCENIELSDLKVLRSPQGVFMRDCVNSLVKEVAAFECSSNGFWIVGRCTQDPDVRTSRNNCFMQCQVYGTTSTGDIFGFHSVGGQNNSFIECMVKDLNTSDTEKASTVAAFCLGTTEAGDNPTVFCNECGTKIIDCEVCEITAKAELDPTEAGASTPIGIKLDSVFNSNFDESTPPTQLDEVIFPDTPPGPPDGQPVFATTWSPDGCYLATGLFDRSGSDKTTIDIFKVNQDSGELGFTDKIDFISGGSETIVRQIRFSPDGCCMVAVGQTNLGKIEIFSFDPTTGTAESEQAETQGEDVAFSVAFTPDGCFLATGSDRIGGGGGDENLQIRMVNKDDCTLSDVVDSVTHGDEVTALVWSNDGRFLYSGADETGAQIKVWKFDAGSNGIDDPTLTELVAFEEAQPTAVVALALSPDGCYLASGSVNATDNLKVWKVNKETGELTEIVSRTAQETEVNSLSWSLDGKFLASCGDFDDSGTTVGNVKIWAFDRTSTPSLTELTNYISGTEDDSTVKDVAFSPTNCFLASGARDGADDDGTSEGILEIRDSGIIFPKESTIKRNEVVRVTGGCCGFGVVGGCDNLFLNNLVNEADVAYTGVTNVYAKGLLGIPTAFDNLAFPPTCTLGQCDHIDRSGPKTVKKSPTKKVMRSKQQPTRGGTQVTRSPSSSSSVEGASLVIRGLPYIIKKPGTYTLATTATVTNGDAAITIASSDVTLDLGGQIITGSGLAYGVRTQAGLGPCNNVTIINGTIREMTSAGIFLEDATNVSIGNVNVVNNEIGIHVEGTPIITPIVDIPSSSNIFIGQCRAAENDRAGYFALGVSGLTFLETVAMNNGLTSLDPERGGYLIDRSIDVAIEASIAKANHFGYRFELVHSGAMRSCMALFNENDGFLVTGDTGVNEPAECVTLERCKALHNLEKGMHLNFSRECTILECEAKLNTEEGIFVSEDSDYNQVIRNNVVSNGKTGGGFVGIHDVSTVATTTNRIFGNFAQNNNIAVFETDPENDNNYTNTPAIVQISPVPTGVPLSGVAPGFAGSVGNIST